MKKIIGLVILTVTMFVLTYVFAVMMNTETRSEASGVLCLFMVLSGIIGYASLAGAIGVAVGIEKSK